MTNAGDKTKQHSLFYVHLKDSDWIKTKGKVSFAFW